MSGSKLITHHFARKGWPLLQLACENAPLEECLMKTAEVDGRTAQRSDWSEVALLPGTHRIRWRMTPGGSMSQGAEPLIAPGGIEVAFVAGHAYTLRAGHARKTYRLYLWIEDAGSATLVAGERPP